MSSLQIACLEFKEVTCLFELHGINRYLTWTRQANGVLTFGWKKHCCSLYFQYLKCYILVYWKKKQLYIYSYTVTYLYNYIVYIYSLYKSVYNAYKTCICKCILGIYIGMLFDFICLICCMHHDENNYFGV